MRKLGRRWTGYLENAVVIFTSDHGDCLTDHGYSQKWTMYDTITRVPTLIWSPGRFEVREIDDLVQLMDLRPTILDLAGEPVPETMEAMSLLPMLEGQDGGEGRDYVFAEHPRDGILNTEFMTMIRSKDWKLVHFLDEPFGQLFNLAEDPGEVINLWDDPGCTDKKRELLDAMRDWLIRCHGKTGDWKREWR